MNPQFVIVENSSGAKALVNTEDIKFAQPYAQDVNNSGGGVRVEFRSGGWLNIPGITVDSLASAVNGAPY